MWVIVKMMRLVSVLMKVLFRWMYCRLWLIISLIFFVVLVGF